MNGIEHLEWIHGQMIRDDEGYELRHVNLTIQLEYIFPANLSDRRASKSIIKYNSRNMIFSFAP